MRVYLDSSAIIKRAIDEPESDAVELALERHAAADDVLMSSSLAWIEVTRGLRTRLYDEDPATITALSEDALSGIRESPIAPPIVALARRLEPSALRSLDAIHLATALILDADLVIAYDARLIEAVREHGLRTSSPA